MSLAAFYVITSSSCSQNHKTCPDFLLHALVFLFPLARELSVEVILLLAVLHLKPRLLIFVLKIN
jgi:hypothetical protein